MKFKLLSEVLFAICVGKSFCLNDEPRKFPENFKFGVATAAFQIEGAWVQDGKGESIWDELTHYRPDLIVGGDNADITCDSYNNYKRDIEMLTELGVNFYRFSISWSRILPTGFINRINKSGLDYYNNITNGLIANGITPVITIYHWDLPQPLQELGGWTNPLMPEYFENFARVAFEAFGDRVKDWITFNEPVEVCLSGYGHDWKAPALDFNGVAEYLCGHNLLKAHARVYHLYEEIFKLEQKGRVSISLSGNYHEPKDNSTENIEAAEKAIQFDIGWFANPIFSREGDYPSIMKEAIAKRSQEQGYRRSRLPVFTPSQVEYIRGTYDFLGINHYTSRMTKVASPGQEHPVPSFDDDLGVINYSEKTWDTAQSDWLKVTPWGFRKLLNWLNERYDSPEIVIFENGFSDQGEMNDTRRMDYIAMYLNAMLDAIQDGCNVTAYTVWTLMDNFEWRAGYSYFNSHALATRVSNPKQWRPVNVALDQCTPCICRGGYI